MRARAVLRRLAPVLGALACFALALSFAALAADMAAWRGAFPEDDVRYRVAPQRDDLWTPRTLAPWLRADALLGVEDDALVRDAVRALALARLDDPFVSDTETAVRRSVAQALLQTVATEDEDPVRASRAAGLLGVLGLVALVTQTQNREELSQAVLANLRTALDLDPGNDEAKHNLELALQSSRGVDPAESGGGTDTSPGGAGRRGAGTGDAGSGY